MISEVTSHTLIVTADRIKTESIESFLNKCRETAKKSNDLTESKIQRLGDTFCSRAFNLFSKSLKDAFPQKEYLNRVDILISAKKVDFFGSSLRDRMIEALTTSQI